MASDNEKRRRHNEAKARALAILSDSGIEAKRARSGKAKAKALRLLAELDAKDIRGRRALERLVTSAETETESLEALMARLLRADVTRRREMINEVVTENVSRWPSLLMWRGQVVSGTWQGRKVR